VEHLCVKFGDPSCIDFWDIVQKIDRQTNRQTDRQTNVGENPSPATAVVVGNKPTQKRRVFDGAKCGEMSPV